MRNPFTIFTTSQYSFEGRKSYENVIVLLYRHWFILLVRFVLFIATGLLPFIISAWLGEYITRTGLNDVFWFFVGIYGLAWWYALFYALTIYLLDTWIVTDHRIVDSEQHGFFNRTVAELHLGKIQDISVHVSGPIQTFLDFGDLEVQTAGADRKFNFRQIPHPNQVKDQIMHAHNTFLAQHRGGQEVHEEV